MKNQHGEQATCVVATWASFKSNSIHTVAFYVLNPQAGWVKKGLNIIRMLALSMSRKKLLND